MKFLPLTRLTLRQTEEQHLLFVLCWLVLKGGAQLKESIENFLQSMTGKTLTFTGTLLSLTGAPLSMTGTPLTFTGTPLSLTGAPLSMTGTPLTFMGTPLSLTGTSLTFTGTSLSMTGTRSFVLNQPKTTVFIVKSYLLQLFFNHLNSTLWKEQSELNCLSAVPMAPLN